MITTDSHRCAESRQRHPRGINANLLEVNDDKTGVVRSASPNSPSLSLSVAHNTFLNIRVLLCILSTLPVTRCSSKWLHSGLTYKHVCAQNEATSVSLMHLHRDVPICTASGIDEYVPMCTASVIDEYVPMCTASVIDEYVPMCTASVIDEYVPMCTASVIDEYVPMCTASVIYENVPTCTASVIDEYARRILDEFNSINKCAVHCTFLTRLYNIV